MNRKLKIALIGIAAVLAVWKVDTAIHELAGAEVTAIQQDCSAADGSVRLVRQAFSVESPDLRLTSLAEAHTFLTEHAVDLAAIGRQTGKNDIYYVALDVADFADRTADFMLARIVEMQGKGYPATDADRSRLEDAAQAVESDCAALSRRYN